MANVYEIVTERIIAQLEKGVIPWRKPWATKGAAGLPKNAVSKREYRGMNVWLLISMGYASPYWLTYKQAQTLGGSVKKGEKGTPVVFWKFSEKKGKDETTGEDTIKKSVFLRYYTVFNVAQCEGLKLKEEATATDEATNDVLPIDAAEAIVRGYEGGPEIKEGQAGAWYRPATDVIGMPNRNTFTRAEEYYSTLFHEMTHSTGAQKRLARAGVVDAVRFGSEPYGREELVAEMGAAFLCGMAGIENTTIANSAAYVSNWLDAIKGDSRLVVIAASQAQKAADLILGRKPEEKGEDAEGETQTNGEEGE